MMRARERAKRNEDRKEEENLANGVPPNASSITRVRKIRPRRAGETRWEDGKLVDGRGREWKIDWVLS